MNEWSRLIHLAGIYLCRGAHCFRIRRYSAEQIRQSSKKLESWQFVLLNSVIVLHFKNYIYTFSYKILKCIPLKFLFMDVVIDGWYNGPQIHMLIFYLQGFCIRRWRLWQVIRFCRKNPHEWDQCLYKRKLNEIS